MKNGKIPIPGEIPQEIQPQNHIPEPEGGTGCLGTSGNSGKSGKSGCSGYSLLLQRGFPSERAPEAAGSLRDAGDVPHAGIAVGSLGSLWGLYGIAVGLPRRAGIAVGPLWDLSGISPGSLWDRCGISAGSQSDLSEIAVGSLRDRSGISEIAVGSLWDRSGMSPRCLRDLRGIAAGRSSPGRDSSGCGQSPEPDPAPRPRPAGWEGRARYLL